MTTYQAIVELELPDVDTDGTVTTDTVATVTSGDGNPTGEAADLGVDHPQIVVTGTELDQDQADDLGYVAA